MENKNSCKVCGKTGDDIFYKSDKNTCKACIIDRVSGRTKPEGLIRFLYQCQISNGIKGHNLKSKPEYSFTWFRSWCIKQGIVAKWKEWICNGSESYSKPSVDRIDSAKGYTKINIRITTWRGNMIFNYADRIRGRGIYCKRLKMPCANHK